MFELLKKKIGHSVAYPHFLSILFHFLQLPREFVVWISFSKKYYFFVNYVSFININKFLIF